MLYGTGFSQQAAKELVAMWALEDSLKKKKKRMLIKISRAMGPS